MVEQLMGAVVVAVIVVAFALFTGISANKRMNN